MSKFCACVVASLTLVLASCDAPVTDSATVPAGKVGKTVPIPACGSGCVVTTVPPTCSSSTCNGCNHCVGTSCVAQGAGYVCGLSADQCTITAECDGSGNCNGTSVPRGAGLDCSNGRAEPTCQFWECNGGGSCVATNAPNTSPGANAYGCTTGATDCASAGYCSSGSCVTNKVGSGTPAGNCSGGTGTCLTKVCDGGGNCTTENSTNGQPGSNCGAAATDCASAQFCSGGSCTTTPIANGTPHGNCTGPTGTCQTKVCNGAGGCGSKAAPNGASGSGCSATGDLCCNSGMCVTSLVDAANCGGCGTMCPGGDVCSGGNCCPTASPNWCGAPVNACENLMTSTTYCGNCTTTCGIAGTTAIACTAGVCTPTCDGTHQHCTGNPSQGCETAINTSTNCGGCGVVCTVPSPGTATNICTASSSGGGAQFGCQPTCKPGFGDCDKNPANGCETTTNTSIANCGACGNACPVPANAAPTCSNGTCDFTCNTDYKRCQGQCIPSGDCCQASDCNGNACQVAPQCALTSDGGTGRGVCVYQALQCPTDCVTNPLCDPSPAHAGCYGTPTSASPMPCPSTRCHAAGMCQTSATAGSACDGTPVACSTAGLNLQCATAVCDEVDGCRTVSLNEGMTCTDSCQTNATCQSGRCVGAPVCTGGTPCAPATCNNGGCQYTALQDGAACTDVCGAGQCVGGTCECGNVDMSVMLDMSTIDQLMSTTGSTTAGGTTGASTTGSTTSGKGHGKGKGCAIGGSDAQPTTLLLFMAVLALLARRRVRLAR